MTTEMPLRPFAFNNGAILQLLDYRAAVKLETTNVGKLPRANLTLASVTVPSFDFLLKKLQ